MDADLGMIGRSVLVIKTSLFLLMDSSSNLVLGNQFMIKFHSSVLGLFLNALLTSSSLLLLNSKTSNLSLLLLGKRDSSKLFGEETQKEDT